MLPLIVGLVGVAILTASCSKSCEKEISQEEPSSKKNEKTYVPPPPNGVYMGAFLGDRINKASVFSFEEMSGQNLDIGLKYLSFSTGLYFPKNEAEIMAKQNGVLYIKLEPGGMQNNSSYYENYYSFESIVKGSHDDLLARFARGAAEFGKPVLVSFGHEMNGSWYQWGGLPPEEYKNAFRYVHDKIEKIAPNIDWVYNPNIDQGRIEEFYPGDQYVNWVGLDGFSFLSYGCRDFNVAFDEALNDLKKAAPEKPVIIGEFACDAKCSNPTQEEFIQRGIKYIAEHNDQIKAFVWFNINKQDGSWQITPKSEQAWKTGISNNAELFKDSPLDFIDQELLVRIYQGKTDQEIIGLEQPIIPKGPDIEIASSSTRIESYLKFDPTGYNGGRAKRYGSTYTFIADPETKNPGINMYLNSINVSDKKYFNFEIKGTYHQHPGIDGNAVPYIEFHGLATGNRPAIKKQKINVTEDYRTVNILLNNEFSNINMIKFLLSTNYGKCDFTISNPRFE